MFSLFLFLVYVSRICYLGSGFLIVAGVRSLGYVFWVMVSRVWFPCQRLLVSSFLFLVSYFLDLIPVSGFQILVNLFPVSGFPFLGLKLVGSQVAVSSF